MGITASKRELATDRFKKRKALTSRDVSSGGVSGVFRADALSESRAAIEAVSPACDGRELAEDVCPVPHDIE
jgi:hypothetical protein